MKPCNQHGIPKSFPKKSSLGNQNAKELNYKADEDTRNKAERNDRFYWLSSPLHGWFYSRRPFKYCSAPVLVETFLGPKTLEFIDFEQPGCVSWRVGGSGNVI